MTRLPALTARFAPLALQLPLRALPRQLTALLSRQRRIRRRRHRTVARGAVHLPLKLLEPLLQPSHLVQRIKQPDNQRPCRLPTSHRDRFRLDPIHDRRIPSIQKESCSPPRHHLNACLRPGWVPPVPRGRRCSSRLRGLLNRRLPLLSGQSLYSAAASHRRSSSSRDISQRFKVLHPSDLPLACGPRMERALLGFCLMLRTPPGTPATHVRPRPGPEHEPGTTPSIFVEPPINVFTHIRATSRRRPCGRLSRPPWCGVTRRVGPGRGTGVTAGPFPRPALRTGRRVGGEPPVPRLRAVVCSPPPSEPGVRLPPHRALHRTCGGRS